jgi:hypothetical protein
MTVRQTIVCEVLMKAAHSNFAREARLAKSLCGDLSKTALKSLESLVGRHQLSLVDGDLKYLNSGWYVTHSGLLRLAERRHCGGMDVRPVLKSSDPTSSRWVFRCRHLEYRQYLTAKVSPGTIPWWSGSRKFPVQMHAIPPSPTL